MFVISRFNHRRRVRKQPRTSTFLASGSMPSSDRLVHPQPPSVLEMEKAYPSPDDMSYHTPDAMSYPTPDAMSYYTPDAMPYRTSAAVPAALIPAGSLRRGSTYDNTQPQIPHRPFIPAFPNPGYAEPNRMEHQTSWNASNFGSLPSPHEQSSDLLNGPDPASNPHHPFRHPRYQPNPYI